MNTKGQGSGVFQLLISAIVALAILGVLMGVLGVIPIFGNQDPTTAARDQLKSAYNAQGTAQFSSKVTFSKDKVLTRAGVTPNELGLPRDNVCITWPTSLNTIFTGSIAGEGRAAYTGTGSRDAKIAALCDTGEGLEGTASSPGTVEETFGPAISAPSACTTNPQEVYCIVVILPP